MNKTLLDSVFETYLPIAALTGSIIFILVVASGHI